MFIAINILFLRVFIKVRFIDDVFEDFIYLNVRRDYGRYFG